MTTVYELARWGRAMLDPYKERPKREEKLRDQKVRAAARWMASL